MDKTKYKELLGKLDLILNADGSIPSVSPALGRGSNPSVIFITPDLDVERLSQNDLTMTHAMLHKLYATGTKTITREQIKILHEKVRLRMSHSDFDSLDE